MLVLLDDAGAYLDGGGKYNDCKNVIHEVSIVHFFGLSSNKLLCVVLFLC